MKKILIFGLPGSGKTTLARALAPKLKAVHWNADSVRANINTHLGFSESDREEQAKRMSWLCDQVVKSGNFAIADFVCPTKTTRDIFGPAYKIWMNTIKESRFEDTNKMFEVPKLDGFDLCINEWNAEFWSKYIAEELDFQENPTWFKAMMRGL